MSSIKSKDTGIERKVRSELARRGLRFRKHVRSVVGKPDIVFVREKIAIFLDGDFWHGYRLKKWKHKLSLFWLAKIEGNIKRDKRNFAALRRQQWVVKRFWSHQINRNPEAVAFEIGRMVKVRRSTFREIQLTKVETIAVYKS